MCTLYHSTLDFLRTHYHSRLDSILYSFFQSTKQYIGQVLLFFIVDFTLLLNFYVCNKILVVFTIICTLTFSYIFKHRVAKKTKKNLNIFFKQLKDGDLDLCVTILIYIFPSIINKIFFPLNEELIN